MQKKKDNLEAYLKYTCTAKDTSKYAGKDKDKDSSYDSGKETAKDGSKPATDYTPAVEQPDWASGTYTEDDWESNDDGTAISLMKVAS